MASSPILFFFFLLFLQKATSSSNVTSCPSSCPGNTLEIRFPFGFDNSRCTYPGFNISCNNHDSQIFLNLPHTGNFAVEAIYYRSQAIAIRDPENCLAKRFLSSSFNLSGSPFFPEFETRFFTFLNCSSNSTAVLSGFRRVLCLSNENWTVLAIPTVNFEFTLPYLPPYCTEMKRRVWVPIMWPRWSESETRLIWDEPLCLPCEEAGGTCRFKGSTGTELACDDPNKKHPIPRSAKYGIIIGAGIPGLIAIIGIGSCMFGRFKAHYIRRHQPTTEFSTSIAPQPCVVVTGLDGQTIESYPKTQLGDSGRLPKPNDSTCPICLCEYQPRDTLRTIPDCNHYFHAACIDGWLKMKASCPVCRISPDGSEVITPSSSLSSSSSSSSTPS